MRHIEGDLLAEAPGEPAVALVVHGQAQGLLLTLAGGAARPEQVAGSVVLRQEHIDARRLLYRVDGGAEDGAAERGRVAERTGNPCVARSVHRHPLPDVGVLG